MLRVRTKRNLFSMVALPCRSIRLLTLTQRIPEERGRWGEKDESIMWKSSTRVIPERSDRSRKLYILEYLWNVAKSTVCFLSKLQKQERRQHSEPHHLLSALSCWLSIIDYLVPVLSPHVSSVGPSVASRPAKHSPNWQNAVSAQFHNDIQQLTSFPQFLFDIVSAPDLNVHLTLGAYPSQPPPFECEVGNAEEQCGQTTSARWTTPFSAGNIYDLCPHIQRQHCLKTLLCE